MSKEQLMQIKKAKRAKRPVFYRQSTHKKKRLDKIWRKPRGKQSKLRLGKQKKPVVNPGFGSPAVLRDIHISGLSIVKVESIKDIASLNPKIQGAIVSAKLGLRKKLPILKELLKNKIKVLNIPNLEDYINKKQSYLEEKKKRPVEKKEEPKEEKKPSKESIEDKLSEEEKKKVEKEEIDRLLTKKF